jgi:hypothetical protein
MAQQWSTCLSKYKAKFKLQYCQKKKKSAVGGSKSYSMKRNSETTDLLWKRKGLQSVGIATGLFLWLQKAKSVEFD